MAAFLLVVVCDVAPASTQIMSVHGEYFRALNLPFAVDHLHPGSPEALAKEAARDKCQAMGYEHTFSFYFEVKGTKHILTDVFCSHDQATDENNRLALARAIIVRDRKARKAYLNSQSYAILRTFKDIEIKGYKITSPKQKADKSHTVSHSQNSQ